MRALPLLSAVLFACAAPPCDFASCREACEAVGVPVRTQPDNGAPFNVLTAYEARMMADSLKEVRDGAQAAPGVNVCMGTTSCEKGFGTQTKALPPGTYHIVVPYTLTNRARANDWTSRAAEHCTVDDLTEDGHVITHHKRFDTDAYKPLEPGGGTLRVLAFTSPAERPTACAWRVTFIGPAGQMNSVEGTYTVPMANPEGIAPDPTPPPEPVPAPDPEPTTP